jgi:hypothetical protein
MKNHRMSIAAAILIMAASSNAMASEAPTSAASVVESNTVSNPSVRREGERVLVNYLNLEGSTVVIQVVDEENRLLYFERFTDSTIVEKAINFENALSGTYKVQIKVSGGARSFSESLKVVR